MSYFSIFHGIKIVLKTMGASGLLFFVPIGKSKPKRGFCLIRKDKDEKYEMVINRLHQAALADRL